MGYFGSKFFSLKYWGKFFVGLSGGLPAPTVSDIIFRVRMRNLIFDSGERDLAFSGVPRALTFIIFTGGKRRRVIR